jgi:murein L,D-transpeptidase YafK
MGQFGGPGIARASVAIACAVLLLGRAHALVPTEYVDRILVDKSDRELVAYARGREVRRFKVALGFGGLKPKVRQGDGRVPEGNYRITAHNPNSAYHLSLRIGYPTEAQKLTAKRGGYDPGGDIMIHGLPNGQGWIGSAHRQRDWTAGCIAVTNEEIGWLYARVRDGTPIHIRQ